jgi:hypothetical protein
MDSIVKSGLDLLGYPVRDKVTGHEGVVTSVTFDLYGCVQGIVHPGKDKDGKLQEPNWFDVKRLEVTGPRVMESPSFATIKTGTEQGPAERPAIGSQQAPAR